LSWHDKRDYLPRNPDLQEKKQTITMTSQQKKQLMIRILFTGLLAGTLDILFVWVRIYPVAIPRIFRFVASGFFGPAVAGSEEGMAVWGGFFHFFNALCWTTFFFLLYPFLIKVFNSKIILIFVAGIIIWAVMNFIVIPLSHVPPSKFHLCGSLRELGVLTLAYGLPIILITGNFYRKIRNSPAGAAHANPLKNLRRNR
jgi:hypothetical protein